MQTVCATLQQADDREPDNVEEQEVDGKKKRTFRKYSYRGVDLDQLLDLSTEQVSTSRECAHTGWKTRSNGTVATNLRSENQFQLRATQLPPTYGTHHPASIANSWFFSQLIDLMHSRARRKFQRGLKRKPMGLIKKLRKAKKEAQPNEKPAVVKTHLRNMIIVPEMIGSVVGVYNGKTFNQVEIKPEMTGHYLGEFSITYKPVKHGRPGIGATHSSRFIPREFYLPPDEEIVFVANRY